jgi:hypothetical protein
VDPIVQHSRRIHMIAASFIAVLLSASAPAVPIIEAEEAIYTSGDARNGAGPLWCYGARCIVRSGSRLFASGLETLPGVEPLNNCRWMLFEREPDGWKLRAADPKGRTREPCPLGAFPGGRLFALYYVGGSRNGQAVSENRLREIYLDGGGTAGEAVRVPFEHPFTNFMTATERLGSPASDAIDILGQAAGRAGISCARIRLRIEG